MKGLNPCTLRYFLDYGVLISLLKCLCKTGSLCIFLCRGRLFRQGSYYFAPAESVFVCCAMQCWKCLLSFFIQGPGVWPIVKRMWGDKYQVFDSPQACYSGGQGPGLTEHCTHFSCDHLFDLSVFHRALGQKQHSGGNVE